MCKAERIRWEKENTWLESSDSSPKLLAITTSSVTPEATLHTQNSMQGTISGIFKHSNLQSQLTHPIKDTMQKKSK